MPKCCYISPDAVVASAQGGVAQALGHSVQALVRNSLLDTQVERRLADVPLAGHLVGVRRPPCSRRGMCWSGAFVALLFGPQQPQSHGGWAGVQGSQYCTSPASSPHASGADAAADAAVSTVFEALLPGSLRMVQDADMELKPEGFSLPVEVYNLLYVDCDLCTIKRHPYVDNGHGCTLWRKADTLHLPADGCEFIYDQNCGTSPKYKIFDETCPT
ncbi:hypothetical protein HPB49_020738 [Dermacentor silvarum]|uniref:Uncharacterized protein n=1 Tax=Dermacentor silvarum TaxID=543639 RepID=A0ACB8C5B0_DERSI|nr:hypothetical protein HPB49_020738 [Dermacentor silvarum]